MEWISIEDKLPKFKEEKLLWFENKDKEISSKGFCELGYLKSITQSYNGTHLEFVDNMDNQVFNVTHWMQLPEPPKN